MVLRGAQSESDDVATVELRFTDDPTGLGLDLPTLSTVSSASDLSHPFKSGQYP
jgi:hypothetical protein